MEDNKQLYMIRARALPEALLKVAEAKKLLDSAKVDTVQEAVDRVGLSRSTFYKYKDDIFAFHENAMGTTINITFEMEDEPGLLSEVLKTIADYKANILTIHQSIPINGMASLNLSIQVLPTTEDTSEMVTSLQQKRGVHHVKLVARDEERRL